MRPNGMQWIGLAAMASIPFAVLVACRQPTTEAAASMPARSLQPRSSAAQAQPGVEGCFVPGQTDPGVRAWCLMKKLVTANGDLVWEDWHPDPRAGLGAYPCPQSGSPSGAQLGLLKAGTPSVDSQHMEFLKAMRMARQVKAATLEGKAELPAGRVAAPALAASASAKGSPAQLAASATSQFAEILYNDAAIQSICGQVTESHQANLVALLNGVAGQSGPAGRFHLDRPYPVVIKTIWAKVPANSTSALMTIWDPEATNLDPAIPPRQSVEQWNTLIRVDDTQPSPSAPTCDFQPPADPGGYQGKQFLTVPLGCFYSLPVSKEENVVIDTGRSGAIFHDSEPGPGGFRLVLLGFHVAAQGTDGWTWQTFWWSAQGLKKGTSDYKNRIGNPFYDPNRRDDQQKPLAYYRMDASNDGGVALYNPYLEARLPSGSQTSCASCHSHAAFHADNPKNHDPKQTPESLFLQAQDCRLRQCPLIPGGVFTDMLWSLADSNVAAVNSPDGPS